MGAQGSASESLFQLDTNEQWESLFKGLAISCLEKLKPLAKNYYYMGGTNVNFKTKCT